MGLTLNKVRAWGAQDEAPDTAAPPALDASYEHMAVAPVEVTQPGPIVRPDGTSQCSWSRRACLDLNFEDARFYSARELQRLRMKKWDMYHLVSPEHYVTFLVAWVGYSSFCSAHVYTIRSRAFVEDTNFRPPDPETPMMRNSTSGTTDYRSPRAGMSFAVDGEVRRIRVDWPGFAKIGLRADIDFREPPGHESICAVHAVNPRRAYYSRKITCMPARGELRWGSESLRLDPMRSWGMLDFGRGYYPDKMFWYWSTASGKDDKGRTIGWNLGHGNDPKSPAENAVFCDGRLHKIGPVRCQVPQGDLMKPWRVFTDDRRVDLTLTPEKVRRNSLTIGPLHTMGRPAYGRYHGQIALDSGEIVPIRDFFGLYEWFDHRW